MGAWDYYLVLRYTMAMARHTQSAATAYTPCREVLSSRGGVGVVGVVGVGWWGGGVVR